MSIVVKIRVVAGIRIARLSKCAYAGRDLYKAKDQVRKLVWNDRTNKQQQNTDDDESLLRARCGEAGLVAPCVVRANGPSLYSADNESEDVRQN